jgi:hypothetical protein
MTKIHRFQLICKKSMFMKYMTKLLLIFHIPDINHGLKLKNFLSSLQMAQLLWMLDVEMENI